MIAGILKFFSTSFGKKLYQLIENIILVLITVFVMSRVYAPQINDLVEANKQLIEVLSEPRYQITNDFDKVKNKDGNLVLDLNNDLTVANDSAQVNKTKKEGIFKRIFKGKDK